MDGDNNLARRDVVFLGRIRPDALEAALDSRAIVAAETQESMILTPEALQSMFGRADISDVEARATIDYLQHGLLPIKSAEKTIFGDGNKATQGLVAS